MTFAEAIAALLDRDEPEIPDEVLDIRLESL